MSKVVVTGANGFLGSWLCRELSRQGHEVHALVRKTSDLSELEGVPCKFVYGDVTDLSSLLSAFKNCDSIFHLAGLIAYKKSMRPMMEKMNVLGTSNVIEACQQANIRKLVHLSSVVTIGASFQKNQVLNEDSKYNVEHLNLGYFETKRKAEKLVQEAVRNGKQDAVILNPSTIYGAGDARKGSRNMQLKVARGRLPFYTNGGVSVVAVEDVVSGILSAWAKGRSGERYILCSENISIKRLFQMIAAEAGVQPPSIQLPDFVLHALGTIGDTLQSMGINKGLSRENAWTSTLYHWFDCSKARKELGFQPRPASFAIHNSVQWIKQHGLLNENS